MIIVGVIFLAATIKMIMVRVLERSCSTPFRSDPIGGSESDPGCSFNSFYLLFIWLSFFFFL